MPPKKLPKKAPKKPRHTCFQKVNEALAEYNTRLQEGFSFPDFKVLRYVAVEKIDAKKRKPPKNVICSYCPFCGKNLDDAQ